MVRHIRPWVSHLSSYRFCLRKYNVLPEKYGGNKYLFGPRAMPSTRFLLQQFMRPMTS